MNLEHAKAVATRRVAEDIAAWWTRHKIVRRMESDLRRLGWNRHDRHVLHDALGDLYAVGAVTGATAMLNVSEK